MIHIYGDSHAERSFNVYLSSYMVSYKIILFCMKNNGTINIKNKRTANKTKDKTDQNKSILLFLFICFLFT